jgi:hypothetical protein
MPKFFVLIFIVVAIREKITGGSLISFLFELRQKQIGTIKRFEAFGF